MVVKARRTLNFLKVMRTRKNYRVFCSRWSCTEIIIKFCFQSNSFLCLALIWNKIYWAILFRSYFYDGNFWWWVSLVPGCLGWNQVVRTKIYGLSICVFAVFEYQLTGFRANCNMTLAISYDAKACSAITVFIESPSSFSGQFHVINHSLLQICFDLALETNVGFVCSATVRKQSMAVES